jgi:hypothetical protein
LDIHIHRSLYQQQPEDRLNTANYVKVLSTYVDLNDCGEEFAMKEYDLLDQDLILLTTASKGSYDIDVSVKLY